MPGAKLDLDVPRVAALINPAKRIHDRTVLCGFVWLDRFPVSHAPQANRNPCSKRKILIVKGMPFS
jgi:hypothetical protein